MKSAAPAFGALLEPPGLIGHFQDEPPLGFATQPMPSGTPAFAARFDLLTTADDALRKRVTALPGYRWWAGLLRPRTCFIGTTVSEYTPFPLEHDPEALVLEWLQNAAASFPFLIVKDIPQESPLLDRASNSFARELCAACERHGFVLLEGQALAWVPIDFESTDDYLSRLSPSRRKDIRRKLRARAALQIEEIPTGDPRFAEPALRAAFYALYRQVYAQSEIHFDELNSAFFDRVLQDASLGGIVFVYREQGRMLGWNLCFEVGDALVDKYIGFDYPAARERNLYFISWMQNLDYARRRRLACYVAGWTDPEIKSCLGARFTFTRHAVRPRSRLLRAALRRLAPRFESDRAWAEARAAGRASP